MVTFGENSIVIDGDSISVGSATISANTITVSKIDPVSSYYSIKDQINDILDERDRKKKANCENCGAPVDRKKLECPYCGTPY